jgi:hypothetical protein
MRYQPGCRSLEQHTGPISPRPAQRIQPAGEPKADFILGNFDIAIAGADFCRMLSSLFAGAVGSQTIRDLNPELFG